MLERRNVAPRRAFAVSNTVDCSPFYLFAVSNLIGRVEGEHNAPSLLFLEEAELHRVYMPSENRINIQ